MSESKSETLWDKAKANYLAAKTLYTVHGDDEGILNFVGYHLQQAAELYLKDLLENAGVDYPRTHEIAELLDLCVDVGVVPNQYDFLFSQSDTLTVWESKTRYVKNYHAQRAKVIDALEKLGTIFEKEREQPAQDAQIMQQVEQPSEQRGVAGYVAQHTFVDDTFSKDEEQR